jgi:hypothetical chaperone protein
LARAIGLDFGTTNSALAVASRANGVATLAEFESAAGPTQAFRSVLFFGREDFRAPVESEAGPRAIERYLELDEQRRLLQSLKSFLASRLFTGTQVFGRPAELEDLVGLIVRKLREQAERAFGPLEAPIVVGRPVRFAGASDAEDDARALERLRGALAQAGLPDVVFELEPVAAAYHYEQSLERDELVLIADFGGGTSDFCLMRVGPRVRAAREGATSGGSSAERILGTEGVGIAGDAFDAKLVRNLVAPRLGKGTRHRGEFGRSLPIPAWIYTDLERWHHLALMRSPRTMTMLHELRLRAFEPVPIEALIHIIDCELGFYLYRAVEAVKIELSQAPEAMLRFRDPPVELEARVRRSEFEAWIAEDVGAIEDCVDRLLEQTGVASGDVDRVFMTGGSSFVPAVRNIFDRRFGAERVRTGGELTSVASGLALRALDEA